MLENLMLHLIFRDGPRGALRCLVERSPELQVAAHAKNSHGPSGSSRSQALLTLCFPPSAPSAPAMSGADEGYRTLRQASAEEGADANHQKAAAAAENGDLLIPLGKKFWMIPLGVFAIFGLFGAIGLAGPGDAHRISIQLPYERRSRHEIDET